MLRISCWSFDVLRFNEFGSVSIRSVIVATRTNIVYKSILSERIHFRNTWPFALSPFIISPNNFQFVFFFFFQKFLQSFLFHLFFSFVNFMRNRARVLMMHKAQRILGLILGLGITSIKLINYFSDFFFFQKLLWNRKFWFLFF